MAELWPDTLPQRLNVPGHSYNFGDIAIRSAPSVGPSKVRPRSTAIASPLSGQMYMTTDQLSALKTFYKVTLRGSDVFLFPDVERTLADDALYLTSLYTVVKQKGLLGNLMIGLEAGALASWPGSGQKWLDQSGGGRDFFLGVDGTATSDPTFVGTPGAITLAQYWTSAGTGFFTYDAANEAWMNSLHKDAALFSAVAVYYAPALGANGSLFGTDGNLASKIGFDWGHDTANRLTVFSRNGSGGAPAMTYATPAAVVVASAWNVLGLSIDEAGAAGILTDNASVFPFDATYTAPSAAAATHTLQIAARGGNAVPNAAGSRMAALLVWNGRALTTAELLSLTSAINANYAAPAFPYVNCRFTAAPSVSATTKANFWSVALPMEIVP